MPVEARAVSSSGIWESAIAPAPVPGRCLLGFCACAAAACCEGSASSSVFHAPQSGHLPIHLPVS